MSKRRVICLAISFIISITILILSCRAFFKKVFYDPTVESEYVFSKVKLESLPKDIIPVILPRLSTSSTKKYDFNFLKLIMSKSGRKFKIGFSASVDEDISNLVSNAAQNVGDKKTVTAIANVFILDSGSDKYGDIKPIKFPVYFGVNSIFINFINSKNLDFFKGVTNYRNLDKGIMLGRKFSSQNSGFIDAGLTVYQANMSDFYYLLNYNRVSYFPVIYSDYVQSVYGLRSRNYNEEIDVDQYVMLLYPSMYFVFVDKNNKELYDAIKEGISNALKDGSLYDLFSKYFVNKKTLCSKNFAKRRIIYIPNRHYIDKSFDFKFMSQNIPLLDFSRVDSGKFKTGAQLVKSLRKDIGFKKGC